VIALGRLLLASLFLIAILLDVTEPARAPLATYGLLALYIAFAAAVAAATWKNWWLDFKLAGPAHAVDVALFTAIVYLTEGYTSPFYIFFVFLLLSAAIRWGWRETLLTAVLVTTLYLSSGLLATWAGQPFELYRFIVRTGDLIILSLILIWFGIHQARVRLYTPASDMIGEPMPGQSPQETALRSAMAGAGASSGAFVWRSGDKRASALIVRGGETSSAMLGKAGADLPRSPAFLYDIGANRALARIEQRNLRSSTADSLISPALSAPLGLSEGLAVAIATDTGEGALFLEGIKSLSTDHIDAAPQIAADIAAHLQRHALLGAAAESAEARSRLALARDLHDSVVQFLAGAAFRLEAMRRPDAEPAELQAELNELKTLMLEEQGELRAFITALRSGSQIALAELARDLKALSGRLSRHWNVKCEFSAQQSPIMIPTRLHLDAHQLVREAVANAVRHAGAKSVQIALAAEADEVRLNFINDGAAYPRTANGGRMPQSLRERVEEAGGAIELSRGMGVTKLSIGLPISGAAQ
jgi:signal transduction histidine kinase